MLSKTTSLILMAVLSICVGCVDNPPPEFEDVDQGFSEVKISSGPGYGFCIEPSDLLSLEVEETSSVYEANASIVTTGNPDEDECFQDVYSDDCLVSRSAGPAELSDRQIADLQQVLADIPKKECVRDENMACDPCLVTSITVDDHSVYGDCCGDLNEDFRQKFDDAVQHFEGLGRDVDAASSE